MKALNYIFVIFFLKITKDIATVKNLNKKEKAAIAIRITKINAKKDLQAKLEQELETITKNLHVANQNIFRN